MGLIDLRISLDTLHNNSTTTTLKPFFTLQPVIFFLKTNYVDNTFVFLTNTVESSLFVGL